MPFQDDTKVIGLKGGRVGEPEKIWMKERELRCPYCGGTITHWMDGEPGRQEEIWYCSNCDEDIPVESQHRIRERE